MTKEQTEIAKMLAGTPGFRFEPGMAAYEIDDAGSHRIVRTDSDGEVWSYCEIDDEGFPSTPHIPDLDDWATLGLIIEQIADACERVIIEHSDYDGWDIRVDRTFANHESPGSALASALISLLR